MSLKLQFFTVALCLALLSPATAQTESSTEQCAPTDHGCIQTQIEDSIAAITETRWRDQSYRELAKLITLDNKTSEAIVIIEKIENPDTKAMTIRGIGMAAAELNLPTEEQTQTFAALHEAAEKIDHPPSYAIALTYIAMAQAFAGDDDGAMATAAGMENDALRNKAYAESAEIQAEQGKLDKALESINAIDDAAFRDKAYRLISKIFADQDMLDEALRAAGNIQNSYAKSQAKLYILARRVAPEEVNRLD